MHYAVGGSFEWMSIAGPYECVILALRGGAHAGTESLRVPSGKKMYFAETVAEEADY